MVIHVFKDGTTTTELSDNYVPSDMLERIHDIVKEGNEDEKIQNN